MENISGTTLALTAALGGFVVYNFLNSRKGNRPPGPTPLPIIGNALQMPKEYPWLTFSKWSKTYGDLIQLDVLGQPLIIINSAKIVKDLLDKRSSIYSDRPHFIMAGDLVGYGETVVLQPYGDNWRRQRKIIAQDFNQSIVPRYWPLQEREARILIKNVVKNPSSLKQETQLRIGIIIIRVTYGYYIKTSDDPFLTMPLTAMDNFSAATTAGNFMVDFIPAMRHMPPWMPGSGFLKTAKDWRKFVLDATWQPFEWGKQNLETRATLMPNLCSNMVVEKGAELSAGDEHDLVWAASAVMGGGMDTNMSTALTFFMAMILHPEIQRKAQAELDSVVGQDRLPSIGDKPSLPYLRSIMSEVLRWQPAVPLSLPHALSQDDVYEGMHLPKGALLIPNVWHMLHDPSVYEKPEEFIPERYNNLDSEMQKINDLVFGFGRRACPGMHFAEGTLFAIISTALATCNILPALDSDGKEVPPKVAYSTGTIIFPEDFNLRLEYRNEKAKALLSEVNPVYE